MGRGQLATLKSVSAFIAGILAAFNIPAQPIDTRAAIIAGATVIVGLFVHHNSTAPTASDVLKEIENHPLTKMLGGLEHMFGGGPSSVATSAPKPTPSSTPSSPENESVGSHPLGLS